MDFFDAVARALGLADKLAASQSPLLVFVLLLFFLVSALLLGATRHTRKRMEDYTAMMHDRHEECEDAHIARDGIMLRSLVLVSKVTTLIKSPAVVGRRKVDVSDLENEANDIMLELQQQNQLALKRRERDRMQRERAARGRGVFGFSLTR